MQHDESCRDVIRAVERYQREGLPLDFALRTIMLDRPCGWFVRAEAARLLAIAEGASVAALLIEQFFARPKESSYGRPH